MYGLSSVMSVMVLALATFGWQSIANAKAGARATLEGLPTGFSKKTAVAGSVVGVGMTHYRYKVVTPNSKTPWHAATGYSKPYIAGYPLKIDLKNVTDGEIMVLAIGQDSLGNWQSHENATSAIWIKDTVRPVIHSVFIADPKIADGVISGYDFDLDLEAIGFVADGFGEAHFGFVPASTSCRSASFVDNIRPETLRALPVGVKHIACVKLLDEAGNYSIGATQKTVRRMIAGANQDANRPLLIAKP